MTEPQKMKAKNGKRKASEPEESRLLLKSPGIKQGPLFKEGIHL